MSLKEQKPHLFNDSDPFRRGELSHAQVPTRAKVFRRVKNRTRKQIKVLTTHFYRIIACIWSSYELILMSLLSKWLSLIIKSKLRSYVFWFRKLLILNRNQKGFILSPVYKYLKGMYLHIQETIRAPWRKPTHKKVFFKTNLFKEWMKTFFAFFDKRKTTKNELESDDSDFLQALYGI